MYIHIFKFGGAAVNSAPGIRNVGTILQQFSAGPVLVVVSAMGKTTNALETLHQAYMNSDPLAVVEAFQLVRDYHTRILEELFNDRDHPVFGEVDSLFNQLRGYIRKGHLYTGVQQDYDFEYDQVVSFGELISAAILHHYLGSCGFSSKLFDVRTLIATDSTYRDARVDWETTEAAVQREVNDYFKDAGVSGPIAITQGFIGGDKAGNTTTLGREGSSHGA
jgi:aspartate kinase